MSLKFKTRLKPKAMIDITSLIDLVFLLVAFFLVTSSLGFESSITVHLPKAVQTGEPKRNDIVVTVNENNLIYVDNVEVAKEKLMDAIKQKKETGVTGEVIIRGDRTAHYEQIVFIMDTLNQVGIPKFSIATQD